MESVDDFAINLDINNRKFYDYVHSAVVTFPEEAIGRVAEDSGVIIGGCCCKTDAYTLRVAKILDAHFLDKRFLETIFPQKSSQFSSVGKGESLFASEEATCKPVPQHVMPIFMPGETIRGLVTINLKQKLQAKCVSINLLGRAKTNKRVYHGRGYYDCTKYENFIDETVVVHHSQLEEGNHKFPFTFKIPEGSPSSITQLVPAQDDVAFISLRLKATVDRGKVLARGNVVSLHGIWIDRPMNVTDLAEAWQNVEGEKSVTNGCCSSSGLALKVRLPRSAFARNEEVPVSIEVDNRGCDVKKVEAKIVLKGTGITCCTSGVGFCHKTVGKSDGPVTKGLCPVYQWKLPFDFSLSVVDSNMIPTSETSHISQIINYGYEVVVKAKRGGLKRDIKLCFPITVCTHNEAGTKSS